jgi:asparagine synthase (glutamine-hydrolysing)
MRRPFDGSDEEAVDELEKLLKDTIMSRMVSDVPLGAFLSGGIDSSTIVSLMQSQSERPINTFTMGFHEHDFNEAVHAKKVAQHLGTNHTELYVSPQEAMDVIPKLSLMYDEPFADSSQIPTHLISDLAKKHVTVSLSGDGGDELFGGYTRYFMAERYWDLIRKIPYFLRQWSAKSIGSIPFKHVDNFINRIESFLPHKIKLSHPTEKLYKLGQILSHSSLQSTYQRLVSVINEPDDFIIKGSPSETLIDNLDIWHTFDENVTTMQYIDLMTYHPDDILVKVDRAAMAVSLETRLPYLDHEIVKFATSLPLNKRFRNGQGKWLLRQVLYRYVPETLIERPKMGFGVPIGDWIKGPLRGWAEPLINQERLTREGYFNTQTVSDMWMQHISGGYNRTHELWNILMFQSWLESNK